MICYRCNEYGHGSRNCPNKSAADDPNRYRPTNDDMQSQASVGSVPSNITGQSNITRTNQGVQQNAFTATSIYMDNEQGSDDTSPTTYSMTPRHEASYVTVHTTLTVEQQNEFKPDIVLIDNQSGVNLVSKFSMGVNARPAPHECIIKGISGSTLSATQVVDMVDFGTVYVHEGANANVISLSKCKDRGDIVTFDSDRDVFTLQMKGAAGPIYKFYRIKDDAGNSLSHYGCNMAKVHREFVATPDALVAVSSVAHNRLGYTKPELAAADNARILNERMGFPSTRTQSRMLNHGDISNSSVTSADVARLSQITGSQSIAKLKGTANAANAPKTDMSNMLMHSRPVQAVQSLILDIMFIDGVAFLLAVLYPLLLTFVEPLTSRAFAHVVAAIVCVLNAAASLRIDVKVISSDGEGALQSLRDRQKKPPELAGVVFDVTSGSHHGIVEAKIKVVKERHRTHVAHLPYVMCYRLLIGCVLFVVAGLNKERPYSSHLASPFSQATGVQLNEHIHLRASFGEYLQATHTATDNSADARTVGCIALRTVDQKGGVAMMNLRTGENIVRHKFTRLPMPDEVIEICNSMALRDIADGRLLGPDSKANDFEERTAAARKLLDDIADAEALRNQLPLTLSPDTRHLLPLSAGDADAITDNDIARRTSRVTIEDVDSDCDDDTDQNADSAVKIPLTRKRTDTPADSLHSLTMTIHVGDEERIVHELHNRRGWRDQQFALQMSVKVAMRDRGAEATEAIKKEIKQLLQYKVFTGIKSLGRRSRKPLRCKMFLRDKYFSGGAFEKFKARLVAGGHMQDKSLYDDLSSPTAATSSVFAVAAIAAAEGRQIMTIDVPGAYLHADLPPVDGERITMRLDPLLSQILTELDIDFQTFVQSDGTILVELQKALYGCVESARLWYEALSSYLTTINFIANPEDPCIFNRIESDGTQTTVALHVDDLLVTAATLRALQAFTSEMQQQYGDVTVHSGPIVSYLGLTMNWSQSGKVFITQEGFITDLLSECGVEGTAVTPSTDQLFNVRENMPKSTQAEAVWFRSYVARCLYLGKRTKPEILPVVSFLASRVQACDIDDLSKLRRLLMYIRHTATRGLCLEPGHMGLRVRQLIDVAYGVHIDGRSHTGSATILGNSALIDAVSSKQHIVTKSSTESELVGTSDKAGDGLHVRKFLIGQGYKETPALELLQDNMGSMALIKKGRPASQRTRHMDIRFFWIKERVDNGEINVKHLPTGDMFANVLTKPLQGKQFVRERMLLTNWP
jgi:hypothetical protein